MRTVIETGRSIKVDGWECQTCDGYGVEEMAYCRAHVGCGCRCDSYETAERECETCNGKCEKLCDNCGENVARTRISYVWSDGKPLGDDFYCETCTEEE